MNGQNALLLAVALAEAAVGAIAMPWSAAPEKALGTRIGGKVTAVEKGRVRVENDQGRSLTCSVPKGAPTEEVIRRLTDAARANEGVAVEGCVDSETEGLYVFAVGVGKEGELRICPGAPLGSIQQGLEDLVFSRLFRVGRKPGELVAELSREDVAAMGPAAFKPFDVEYEQETPPAAEDCGEECPGEKQPPKKAVWGARVRLISPPPVDPEDIVASVQLYRRWQLEKEGITPCVEKAGRIAAYAQIEAAYTDTTYCDPKAIASLPSTDQSFLRAARRPDGFSTDDCQRGPFVVFRFSPSVAPKTSNRTHTRKFEDLLKMLSFPIVSRYYCEDEECQIKKVNPIYSGLADDLIQSGLCAGCLGSSQAAKGLSQRATNRGGPYRVTETNDDTIALQRNIAPNGAVPEGPERIYVRTVTPEELRRQGGFFSTGETELARCKRLGKDCLFHGAFSSSLYDPADAESTDRVTYQMLSRHRRDGVIVLAARVGSKDEAGWLIRQMGRTRADLNTLRNRVDLHIGAGVQNSTTTDPHFILPPAYEPEASPRIGAARPEVRSGTIGERPSLTLSFGAGHPELEKIAEDVKKVAKIHSIDIVLKQLPQQEVANQIKAGAGWDLLLHYMIGYSDESASLFRVYTPQLYYNIWAGEDGRWTYTPEHEGDRVPAGLRPHTVGELLHCYESIAVSLFTVKGAGAECPVTVEQMEDALSELSKATRQSPHPYLVLGFPPMYVAATGGQEATWHAETPSRGYGDGVFSNHVKFGWPRPKAGAARGARASSK